MGNLVFIFGLEIVVPVLVPCNLNYGANFHNENVKKNCYCK